MATKYTSRLRNKRVLVLGGTSGIGFCVAEASVEHGAIVIVSSSQQTKIDKTIQRLLDSYPDAKDRISGRPCDLIDPKTAEDNIVELLKFSTNNGQNKLDHVVNTAGNVMDIVPFEKLGVEDVHQAQQVRVVGNMLLSKHIRTYVNESASSSYTLTSGAANYKPNPGMVVQLATIGGMEMLAKVLALQLAPIRVNVVSPGGVLTEIWDRLPKDAIQHFKETQEKTLLVGSLGNPEDVAEAYLYLMRDKFVTGEKIVSDGGARLTS